MKQYFFLFFFIPFLNFSQVQIGQDIYGEAAGDFSGYSVSLSSNGNIVAIGATGNDGNGSRSGHVRVYENISGVWTQIGADIDGETSNSESGNSLSLSSDGSILAIGAPYYINSNGGLVGNVRVYENLSGVWTQIGQNINGEAAGDFSGFSVSLSSDGSIVAIGAISNSDNGGLSGHVRVYENLSGVWTQIGTDIDGEAAFDQSGFSVSLSSDGSIVAIGALGNDGNGDDSGHVRVYENLSGIWTQIGTDINGKASGDQSGVPVSLSSNGNIVAIGARLNDGNGDDSGHVRIYENVSGIWTQIGTDIDGEAAFNQSGFSVSLSSDGNKVAIGAIANDDNGDYSGHVRIYENVSGIWTQIGTDIDGEAALDQSGFSVSLSSDSNKVAIGAITNDDNGDDSGHVRIYDISESALSTKPFNFNSYSIFPNPAKTQFTIQLDNPSSLKNVTIYNNLGQLVLTSKEIIIDTSKLASGLYILEIETIKGKGSKKLIIE